MRIIFSIISLLDLVFVFACFKTNKRNEVDRRMEDNEQVRYLREWNKNHGRS